MADDLKPRRSRSGRAIGGKTPDGGVIVKVMQTGTPVPETAPTRYALHLRRQAANRIRLEKGLPTLPPLKAGTCARCEGWGVVDARRHRCPVCGGTGR